MAFVGEEYYLSDGDYYGLGILDAIFAFVACFAMIGLGYYLSKLGGCFANWLGSLGTRVTSVYCVHWTIYSFLHLVLICVWDNYISQWAIIPVAALVLLVSDLISRLYVRFKSNRKHLK